MKLLAKVAIALTLVLGCVPLLAQDPEEPQNPPGPEVEAPPPAPPRTTDAMEIGPSAPHMSSYGFATPPGWALSAALAPSFIFDSNPLFQSPAVSDEAIHLSGIADLTYVARHNVYQAAYLAGWSGYERYTALDMTQQTLTQTWWHEFSKKSSITVHLKLDRYPTWGGSAFSQSSFGVLLLGLTGLNGLSLRSNASMAQSGLDYTRRMGRHSTVYSNVTIGVAKYVPSSKIELIQLLTAPRSSTWSESIAIGVSHQLKAGQFLGLETTSSFFYITVPDNNINVSYVNAYYKRDLRNGWGFSLSAGPQFIHEQHGSTSPNLYLTAAAQRVTLRSSVRMAITHSYQLGMAQGNLSTWNALGSAERAVRRRMFVGTFANYSQSVSPVSVGDLGTGNTNTLIVAGDAGARLTPKLVWFVNYGFCRQKGALTQERQIDKQMFVTGISLNFNSIFSR